MNKIHQLNNSEPFYRRRISSLTHWLLYIYIFLHYLFLPTIKIIHQELIIPSGKKNFQQ
jgi:hypothetical protein